MSGIGGALWLREPGSHVWERMSIVTQSDGGYSRDENVLRIHTRVFNPDERAIRRGCQEVMIPRLNSEG